MNIDTFIRKLRATRHKKWRITSGGYIRCGCGCPLTVVARPRSKIMNACKVDTAAEMLGISANVMDCIIGAADDRFSPEYEPGVGKLRKRMLAALELTE